MTDRDIKPENKPCYWWELFSDRYLLIQAGLKAQGITLVNEGDWIGITPAQAWGQGARWVPSSDELPASYTAAYDWPSAKVAYTNGRRAGKASKLRDIQRTATGTYTIHMDEATNDFERNWAPLPSGPKTMAHEGAPSPFKNRKARRTEAALARRGR